jgi:hypothetical protein
MAGSPLSANVLREVRLGDGSLAVLKLIGEPQSAEAATLAAWTLYRVPCAPLLDHGVGTHSPDVTHLLLGKVPGAALPHTEMAAATTQAVRLFRRAHLKPPVEVEPLHGFLSPRLHEAVQIWRESGLPSPDDASRVLTDPDIEPVLLHGDAVGFNLLRSRDELALIDPAGVCGPYGRWRESRRSARPPCAVECRSRCRSFKWGSNTATVRRGVSEPLPLVQVGQQHREPAVELGADLLRAAMP